MSNEQYLIVSYFVAALLCCGVGLAAYGWLRRPFGGVMEWIASRHLARSLRRLFPFGLVLPALAGFLSVSYQGCGGPSYEQIVADRAFMVAKNQEQLSAGMDWVAAAVLVWAIVATVCLLAVRRK